MKKNISQISPRYIVDESGKKKEVILDIKIYEKILEELEDYYLGLEAEAAFKDGDFIDFFEANKDIRSLLKSISFSLMVDFQAS